MEGQQFLTEFGHIANAPAGVARVRELVLQLAISGRLVERASPETPVADSLEMASKQRDEYENKYRLRTTRLHPLVEAQPFAIPEHWKWTQLDQLSLYIQRGKGPTYAEHGTVYVASQKCIQSSGFDLRPARLIADDSVASYGHERFLCEGDLLWNSTGTGTVGRIAIFHADDLVRVVADSHVTVVRVAGALPRYVWCVIASPSVQARIHPAHPTSLVSGSTQQVELAASTARGLAIPCPPVEEQLRIVAKVDELMALCDQLEKQQQGRRKLQNDLRKCTLGAVAAATSQELQTAWSRLTENFRGLFSTPKDVGDLRSLCADLALRGELTPRRSASNKASAAELFDQLATRKSGKRVARLLHTEKPFDLPGAYSDSYWYGPFPIAPVIHFCGVAWSPQASRARRQPR